VENGLLGEKVIGVVERALAEERQVGSSAGIDHAALVFDPHGVSSVPGGNRKWLAGLASRRRTRARGRLSEGIGGRAGLAAPRRSVHYGTSAHHQDYGDRTKMTPKLTHERIAKMTFASIYPLYVNKVEKKGRTEADL
jgi:hypothetical protein